MSKLPPIAEVIEEIYLSIMATPKRQRRLRSSTFWDKFGFKVRTKDRVEQVKLPCACAPSSSIGKCLLGTEDKDEWIIMSYVEPELPPTSASDKRRRSRFQRRQMIGSTSWSSVSSRANARSNTISSCPSWKS